LQPDGTNIFLSKRYNKIIFVDEKNGSNRNPGTEAAPLRNYEYAKQLTVSGSLIIIIC
jgi:hypothetical protein